MFVAAMSPKNARPETPQLICTVTHQPRVFFPGGHGKPEARGDQSHNCQGCAVMLASL